MFCAFKVYYSRFIATFTLMFNLDIVIHCKTNVENIPFIFVILLSVFLKEACAKGEFFQF